MATMTKSVRKLEDHAGYAAARAKLGELETTRANLQSAIRAEEKRRHDAIAAGKRGDVDDHANGIKAEAMLIISGGKASSVPTFDLSKAQHEMEVLGAAVRIQTDLVAKARREASRQVCESRLAEHREIAQRLSVALEEFAEAQRAEIAFRDELVREGVEVVAPIKPASWNVGGLTYSDMADLAEVWLAEMQSYIN